MPKAFDPREDRAYRLVMAVATVMGVILQAILVVRGL